MPRPIAIITAVLLALGSVEAIAWWWMHPSATSQSGPILSYRPQIAVRGSKIVDEEAATSSSAVAPNPQSPISPSAIPNSQSPISNLSSITPLPEIYRQSAPMLRCSSGEVFHVDLGDRISLHLAWFEWNDRDTGSVLEAFRHLPEACMGSLGMQLISKEKPIVYTVGLDRRAGPLVANGARSESRDQGTGDRGQEPDHTSSSSPNLQSPISNHTLIFDHTVFQDPSASAGPLFAASRIHAFRAVWVSGTPAADTRRGLDGRRFDQLRTIRLNSALNRYRPSHARVIQGAVRGALNAEAAWAAFEQAMLRDLIFE